MLSFNDWPLKLDLAVSKNARIFFSTLLILSALVLLFSSFFSIWSLLALPFLIIHLHLIEKRYIKLADAQSVLRIECRHGLWVLESLSGKKQENLKLKRYFISPHLISLLFISNERQFYFFSKRKRVLFFSDQVSKEDFRKLLVCLKYVRADLKTITEE